MPREKYAKGVIPLCPHVLHGVGKHRQMDAHDHQLEEILDVRLCSVVVFQVRRVQQGLDDLGDERVHIFLCAVCSEYKNHACGRTSMTSSSLQEQ